MIMGSKVKLEDEAGNVGQLKIVSPLKDEITGNEISFISPFGRTLLLKKVDALVPLAASGGTKLFRIPGIS